MTPSLAIALKDLALLRRDRSNFFFTFVFPIIFAAFFGLIFSGSGSPGRLRVAVVNQDPGPAAAQLARDLASDPAFEIHAVDSRDAATGAIRAGKADAAILIPADYEASLGGIFTGRALRLEAITAPGRRAEAGLLTGKLHELAFQQIGTMMADPDRLAKPLADARDALARDETIDTPTRLILGTLMGSIEGLAQQQVRARERTDTGDTSGTSPDLAGPAAFRPIDIAVDELPAADHRPQNPWEVSMTQGLVWALMGVVTAFAASIANERTRGTLIRLCVAPMRRHEILLGKALGCFLACLIVQGILIGLGVGLVGVRVHSWPMLLAAATLAALGFVGVMMIMAALARTESGSLGMARAVIMILAMIGGGTIPVFFMPDFMQTLANLSPFKWAVLAYESALWRAAPPAQMLLPGGILLGLALAGLLTGTLAMRSTDPT